MQVLLLLSTTLACAYSSAAGEKYEFLGGETICIDREYVVDQTITAIYGGGGKLASVSVRSGSTVIEMRPDKLLDDAFFQDLATFVQMHPDNVSDEAGGALRKIDVVIRPPAEVESKRLLDRLAPGDGSTWLVVSKSLDVAPEYGRLAEIFLARCQRDRVGGSLCRRQFPVFGFRAEYSLSTEWEGAIEKDREVRSNMLTFVRPCG